LHLRRQPVEALAHVRRTAGQEHPDARWGLQQQRSRSAASTSRSSPGITVPLNRTSAPPGSTTCRSPVAVGAPVSGASAGGGAGNASWRTSTDVKPDIAIASIRLRQV
jgi:hypothetical protein